MTSMERIFLTLLENVMLFIAQYLEDNNIYYIVKGLGGLDSNSDVITITVEQS